MPQLSRGLLRTRKEAWGSVMSKLVPLSIEGDEFLFGLSFDIDDFIGDGIWWLQIYDENRELIYDEPFISSRGEMDMQQIKEIIKDRFLLPGGALL